MTTPTAGPADLTDKQVAYLLGALNPRRVRKTQGNSYLEGWDVRRALTHVFGFGGWADETLELKCVREHAQQGDNGKARWWVTYRAQVRLTVKTPDGRVISSWEDGAIGEASNQPSHGDAHDLAMKTALTGALKRCAVNLGDQFGLSLYRNGTPDPVMIKSLAHKASKASDVDPGPGVAETPTDTSEVGGPQETPDENPPAPPAPAPTEPQEPAEKWLERIKDEAPTADPAQLARIDEEAKARFKAGQIDHQAAHGVITLLNRRRHQLRKETDGAA